MRVLLGALVLALAAVSAAGQGLTRTFYRQSCPTVEAVVLRNVQAAMDRNPTNLPPLLRLFFHDCFVNGCDASVLLGRVGTKQSEQTAAPNLTLKGMALIDAIKAELERTCPGVVSCADILALAARDSVRLAGGPRAAINLGRRDGKVPNADASNNNLPGASADVPSLLEAFGQFGLDVKDLVALSGAHTFGRTRCSRVRQRFDKKSVIHPDFRADLWKQCKGPTFPFELQTDLDTTTPVTFDNEYYRNLLDGLGTLPSDQNLVADKQTSVWVRRFARQGAIFMKEFAASFIKMSEIDVITAPDGEVRRLCRKPNGNALPTQT